MNWQVSRLPIPPEGTCEQNPVPPYVLNQHLHSWQAKQNRERSNHKIGQPNLGSSARPTFEVRHVDPPQGRMNLLEVKEILVEHEASVVKRIKENLGVDIRGNTLVYQKPYPSHFDWAPSPNF